MWELLKRESASRICMESKREVTVRENKSFLVCDTASLREYFRRFVTIAIISLCDNNHLVFVLDTGEK